MAIAMNNAKLYHPLKKNSEIYGNLIEGAPDSIVAVDLKGNIAYCNKATEFLTGYAKEELVGKHFSRLVSMESEEIHRSLKLFKALRKGKKVAPFEMQVKHKSGKPYWIEVHLSRIKAGAKVTGFQVNTRDITDRKKIEATLFRKEKIAAQRAQLLTDLRSLNRIDEILTRVCEVVRDSGLFERAVMTLHKPGGRIAHLGQVGLPPNLIKRARQAPAIDDELKARITNKKFRVSDSFFIPVQAGLDYTKTKRYIPQKEKNSSGGDWQPGDELFVPLWSSSGEIMGYLSVDTPMDGCRPDVKTIESLEMLVEAAAARARELEAQEALSESEEKFRTLAEQSPNMIFIYKRGRVIYANEKCEKVMGYKREEFYAPNFDFFVLIAPEYRKLVKASFARHIIGEDVDPYEYAIITKEGKKIEAILSTKLISYYRENAVLGMITDIAERKRAEESLRESENKYRGLIENLPQKIFLKDKKSVYVSCNENYARDLKIKPEEIAGKTDYDFYPRELAEKYRSDDQRIVRSGNTEDIEEIYLQNGRELWVHTVKTPIKDEKGQCVGLLGIFWDITERKQAEESLRIERERLETVTQNAGVGLAIISKDYRTLWANEVLKQMFGDVEGKICYSTYNQRTEICPGCGVREIFETGRDEVVHEQVGKGIDGNTVWSQIIATPIRDKEGNITAVLEVVVDITERKRAEEDLRKSEEKYRDLVENINDVIYAVDKDGVITYISPTVKSLGGYTPSELIGRSFSEFIDQQDLPWVMEKFQSSISGHVELDEYRVLTKSGKSIWVRGSSRPVFKGSHVTGIQGVLTDITELKRAQEQNLLLETSKALSRTLKLDQVLKIAIEKMAKALKADRCSVMLVDESVDSAAIRHVFVKKDLPHLILPDKRTPPDEHFSQIKEILTKKGYFQIRNAETDPLPASVRSYFRKVGIKSVLLIPLILDKKLFGIFLVASVEKLRSFVSEEISLAQTISNQTAVALQNSLLIEDLKKKHSQIIEQSKILEKQYQEQNILMKISRELSQTLDLDRILQIATKEAAQALRVDRCAASLAFPEEGYAEIRSIYVKGDKSVTHLLGYKLYPHNLPQAKEMFEKRKSINIPNIYHLPDKSFAKEYFIKEGIKSVIFSPMVHGKKLVGFFVLSTMEDFKTFTKEEIRLAQTIADQVAVAIENAKLLELVRKSSEDLKTLSAQLINVQEDERKKIAQELHDEIGQTLFAMKMNLEMTKKNLPPDLEKLEDMKNRLTDTENLLSQTIDQIRNLTTDLRPSMLDDFGLIPALNWYIDNFSKRTNIKVYLKAKNFKPRLSSEVETTFYRIIQEALTNVAKHAQATEVSILLALKNSNACLAVEDNGIGFDAKKATFPKDRLGIFSIKERVGLLNGEFEIHSKANRGTKLSVKIPLVEKRV